MKFTISQNSRQGPRPYNQDRLAYSYSKDALLLVVADGMGGHRNGEVAAQLAVKTLTDAFQHLAVPALANPAKFLVEHVQQVHDMIESLTQEQELIESPRTTVVVAVIQNGYLYCAHVGDSRLYHYRGGHLLFRTEDHSIVQSMHNRGLITYAEMATHPYKNKIYNCVGGDTPPKVALSDKREMLEGDTVMLCSDGIWGFVDDQLIKDILLNTPDIANAVNKLLDSAEFTCEDRGDNMSAIGLQWGERITGLAMVSTQLMPLGQTTTIMNPVIRQDLEGADPDDLSDDDIENTIAEIQAALIRTQQKPKASK